LILSSSKCPTSTPPNLCHGKPYHHSSPSVGDDEEITNTSTERRSMIPSPLNNFIDHSIFMMIIIRRYNNNQHLNLLENERVSYQHEYEEMAQYKVNEMTTTMMSQEEREEASILFLL
jgi:hypothetical protein